MKTIDYDLFPILQCTGNTLIVTCTVTGIARRQSVKSFEARINNMGGGNEAVQKFIDSFMCLQAKQLIKAGKSLEEVKEILNKDTSIMKKKQESKPRKKLTGKRQKKLLTETEGSDGEIKIDYFWRDKSYNPSFVSQEKKTIQALTTNVCMMPNHYLDSRCARCPLKEKCQYRKEKVLKIA